MTIIEGELSRGCDPRPQLRNAQRLSTEPATWQGNPGAAVAIRFATDTEQPEGAEEVGIEFDRSYKGEDWTVSDFTVPVLKLQPRAVTFFFSSRESDSEVPGHLPRSN